MIYVGPVTPWKLFNILCSGTAVASFDDIIFKASRETFKFIQANFNENICHVDKISDEVKAWK